MQKQNKKPYNKQLINLDYLFFTETLKPRPKRIDRAIARSLQQVTLKIEGLRTQGTLSVSVYVFSMHDPLIKQ